MIIQNLKEKITNNFFESEFYSTSDDAPKEHYIDGRLIEIVDTIRDYYDEPVIITSTFRTNKHQIKISGTIKSAHCLGIALDFTISDREAFVDFVNSLQKKELWYCFLRESGVAGIGIYSEFVHIDTRGDNYSYFNNVDNYGDVSLWGQW